MHMQLNSSTQRGMKGKQLVGNDEMESKTTRMLMRSGSVLEEQELAEGDGTSAARRRRAGKKKRRKLAGGGGRATVHPEIHHDNPGSDDEEEEGGDERDDDSQDEEDEDEDEEPQGRSQQQLMAEAFGRFAGQRGESVDELKALFKRAQNEEKQALFVRLQLIMQTLS